MIDYVERITTPIPHVEAWGLGRLKPICFSFAGRYGCPNRKIYTKLLRREAGPGRCPGQEQTKWVVSCVRDYLRTGHVWVQLSVRVMYLLAIGQGKKGATIYRHRASLIIQKASRLVLVCRILSGPSVVIICDLI